MPAYLPVLQTCLLASGAGASPRQAAAAQRLVSPAPVFGAARVRGSGCPCAAEHLGRGTQGWLLQGLGWEQLEQELGQVLGH